MCRKSQYYLLKRRISPWNRCCLIIGLLSVCGRLYSQSPIESDNVYSNLYLLNPASLPGKIKSVAGVDVQMLLSGFPAAPKVRSVWVNGKNEIRNLGWGVMISNQKSGILSNTGIKGSFARLIDFQNQKSVSFGMSLGVNNQRIDFGALNIQDPSEAIFSNNFTSGSYVQLESGIENSWSERLKTGITVRNILMNSIKIENIQGVQVGVFQWRRRIQAYGQYEKDLNNRLKLQILTLVNGYAGLPLRITYSNSFCWNDKFLIGVAGHSTGKIALLTGFQATEKWKVNYAIGWYPAVYKITIPVRYHGLTVQYSLDTEDRSKSPSRKE